MRFYTLDEANAAVPRVSVVVHRIRELLAETRSRAAHAAGNGHAPSANGHGPDAGSAPERQAGADELRALVEELQRESIVLRDPERGLVDFPARSPSGRDYLLCFLDGEERIDFWHWPEAGFAGRTPVSELPD